jgi:hypothetical protein
MKLFKSLIVLFIVLIALSCSTKDDDSATTSNAEDGEMAASVNSTNFTSGDLTTTAAMISGVLNLTGVNSTGDTIAISVNNFDSEGTFDLSEFNTVARAIYLPSGDSTFYLSVNEGGAGSITVTDLNVGDKVISGTFSFIGVRNNTSDPDNPLMETVAITDGVFNKVSITGLD